MVSDANKKQWATMSSLVDAQLDAQVRSLMGFNGVTRKELQDRLYRKLMEDPRLFDLRPVPPVE